MVITISKLLQPRYLLILILVFSLFVRIYKIVEIPPSLSWDEASIGYDAWSLLQDGKDQWGEKLPFIFRSFGEYKYPLHIYITALFVGIFGLTDSIVRLPSALLGVINILLIFFLARYLTNNNRIALVSALFLAISPWHIQFSRVNWETNFVLFFFLVANILFFKIIREQKWNKLLPLSYFLFGLTIYTYNAAKVFIPIYVFLLTFIYWKYLIRRKILLIAGSAIFIGVLFLNLFNPKLSGTVRFQQVDFPNDWIVTTYIYQLTGNRIMSRAELAIKQYAAHFSPQFLFISGDQNPRHSSQFAGQIYLFDGLFIIFGLYFLLKRKRKEDLILLMWFFSALIPASIVKEAPHASRAMFALGSWQIVSAVGLYYLFSKIKSAVIAKLLLSLVAILVIVFFSKYYYSYLNSYPIRYSQDWQYGYKQIFANYKSEFPKYNQVLVSDEYAQPYIFALYYLKYNPEKFRAEVLRNNSSEWGFSTVKSFNNFTFDKVKLENMVEGRNLIFASPKEKLDKIETKDVILNLDGNVAFYVYEYKK